MKRETLPPYVVRKRGTLFFRRGARGKWIRFEAQFPEGAQIPFALHQERERLLQQRAPVAGGRDVAAALRAYRASDKYRRLKPRTRKDYDAHIEYFAAKLGHLEPQHIERHHVIKWRDAWAAKETPHRANYRLRVLSIVMEFAKDMGLLKKGDDNPAKGVESVRYEKSDRQPWPDDKIAAFRATATGRTLLLFELCIGTGQRIGDVLRMQWGHVQDGGIWVTQGKTGKRLWVPFTQPLSAALAATERRSVLILTNHAGTGPWSYRGASQAMRAVREQIGALNYDIHGLRYRTAVELYLAGAGDDVIGAVTGQSRAMVEHYTRAVRQKVLALKSKGFRT